MSPGTRSLVAYTPIPFPGLGRASHSCGGPRHDAGGALSVHGRLAETMQLVPKTRIKSLVIGDMAKAVEICDGVPGEAKVVFLKPL